MASAAFLSMGLGPFAHQKMFQRSQQERAKLPFVPVGDTEIIPRQQAREEFLSQILGIVSAVTFSANVTIERIPVSAAQFFQRLGGLRRRHVTSRQHDAPVRGGEQLSCRWTWTGIRFETWHENMLNRARRGHNTFRSASTALANALLNFDDVVFKR